MPDVYMAGIPELQMYLVLHEIDIITTSIQIVLFIKELYCGINYLCLLDDVSLYVI